MGRDAWSVPALFFYMMKAYYQVALAPSLKLRRHAVDSPPAGGSLREYKFMNPRRLQKITDVVKNRQAGIVAVLEDIHDPHNAAAILRTCDALGIQNVYFIFEQTKKYNPRRVGRVSSSSANKWLDYTSFDSTEACFAALHKDGYEIVVTALGKRAQNLFNADLRGKKIALVIGNEHRGVSETAIKLADRLLLIPMRGMVQSLNVSVAAAICLYEITRQRAASGKNFHLAPKERKKLMESFLKRA